jgi:hypothetical protein
MYMHHNSIHAHTQHIYIDIYYIIGNNIIYIYTYTYTYYKEHMYMDPNSIRAQVAGVPGQRQQAIHPLDVVFEF